MRRKKEVGDEVGGLILVDAYNNYFISVGDPSLRTEEVSRQSLALGTWHPAPDASD